jgi:hypothetical protein
VLVFASSKVTRTCFLSNRTSTFETPTTLSSAFFTVIGHAAQLMPETFKVTVLGDAQAGAANMSATTMTKKMCTENCVKMGGKYVLYSAAKKTVYELDDQQKPAEFAGQNVKVAGSYDKTTKTIHVTSIQAAP